MGSKIVIEYLCYCYQLRVPVVLNGGILVSHNGSSGVSRTLFEQKKVTRYAIKWFKI